MFCTLRLFGGNEVSHGLNDSLPFSFFDLRTSGFGEFETVEQTRDAVNSLQNFQEFPQLSQVFR